MPRTNYFSTPAELAAQRIARRLGREKIGRLARVAEVPERTARSWVEHPERLTQVVGVIALLHAAEVPEGEIAKMVRGTL